MIYKEFRTWRMASAYRCKMFFGGLYGLVVDCIVSGLLSGFSYIGRQIEAFYRRETVAACIITFVFVLMGSGWMLTFMHERAVAVSAQHRADSLAYDVSRITQMYDSTDIIVINGDTIKH